MLTSLGPENMGKMSPFTCTMMDFGTGTNLPPIRPTKKLSPSCAQARWCVSQMGVAPMYWRHIIQQAYDKGQCFLLVAKKPEDYTELP